MINFQIPSRLRLVPIRSFPQTCARLSPISTRQSPGFSSMSWMDSWSRPSKHATVPPPLYLTAGDDVPYCQTCGRVMSARKSQKKGDNIVKYCSDRCRNRKPGATDKKIEQTIVSLLNKDPDSGLEKTDAQNRVVKGDHRVVVSCDEIEELVFGSRHDPEKVFGRRKNRASRVIGKKDAEWKSVDMEDSTQSSSEEEPDQPAAHDHADPRVRPPQTESEVNFSVGGERGWAEKIEETPEDQEKRLQGQKRAQEREMVRRAARRAVVFGFLVDNPTPTQQTKSRKGKRTADEGGVAVISQEPMRRKCEALMNGSLVEPSFAKGNWSIRWRDS